MAEETLHQDQNIQISTKRVAVGGTTYALQNIAGVRVVQTIKKRSVLLTLLGCMIAVPGLIGLSQGDMGVFLFVLVGAAFVGGAVAIGFHRYWLHFDTSSGSVNAYQGKKDYVFIMKSKIEEAMINRS